MSETRFGRRQYDDEDLTAILCVLEENKALEQIAKASHMSHSWIIFLAIKHFGSLSMNEQWELAEKYLANGEPPQAT